MKLAVILPLLAALAAQPGTLSTRAPQDEARQKHPQDVAGPDQDPEKIAREAMASDRAARDALVALLAKEGIQVDLEKGSIRFRAEINRSRMPIEYLIVTPRGATHESLLRTPIRPSLLTSAVYLLGLSKGRNVQIVPKDPGGLLCPDLRHQRDVIEKRRNIIKQ